MNGGINLQAADLTQLSLHREEQAAKQKHMDAQLNLATASMVIQYLQLDQSARDEATDLQARAFLRYLFAAPLVAAPTTFASA